MTGIALIVLEAGLRGETQHTTTLAGTMSTIEVLLAISRVEVENLSGTVVTGELSAQDQDSTKSTSLSEKRGV